MQGSSFHVRILTHWQQLGDCICLPASCSSCGSMLLSRRCILSFAGLQMQSDTAHKVEHRKQSKLNINMRNGPIDQTPAASSNKDMSFDTNDTFFRPQANSFQYCQRDCPHIYFIAALFWRHVPSGNCKIQSQSSIAWYTGAQQHDLDQQSHGAQGGAALGPTLYPPEPAQPERLLVRSAIPARQHSSPSKRLAAALTSMGPPTRHNPFLSGPSLWASDEPHVEGLQGGWGPRGFPDQGAQHDSTWDGRGSLERGAHFRTLGGGTAAAAARRPRTSNVAWFDDVDADATARQRGTSADGTLSMKPFRSCLRCMMHVIIACEADAS